MSYDFKQKFNLKRIYEMNQKSKVMFASQNISLIGTYQSHDEQSYKMSL